MAAKIKLLQCLNSGDLWVICPSRNTSIIKKRDANDELLLIECITKKLVNIQVNISRHIMLNFICSRFFPADEITARSFLLLLKQQQQRRLFIGSWLHLKAGAQRSNKVTYMIDVKVTYDKMKTNSCLLQLLKLRRQQNRSQTLLLLRSPGDWFKLTIATNLWLHS